MNILRFKLFFEEYEGPGSMFDNLGIPRDKMAAVIAGSVFMIGDDKTGKVSIGGKTFSAPLMAKIEKDDAYEEDDKGNFVSGNIIIMPGTMPTQTNKVGIKDGDDMAQAPETSEEEKIHINAAQLKDLLGLGLSSGGPESGMDPMGGMPGMGGLGGL